LHTAQIGCFSKSDFERLFKINLFQAKKTVGAILTSQQPVPNAPRDQRELLAVDDESDSA
jgi:hypothetical protein